MPIGRTARQPRNLQPEDDANVTETHLSNQVLMAADNTSA